LHNRSRVFNDRRQAGLALASLLGRYRGSEAMVLAIPAGGVPVAVTIAESLNLRFGMLVVSKITLPWNPEAGYGAVAADGCSEINQPLVQQLALDASAIEQGIEKTRLKVARREQHYRELLPAVNLENSTALLVDDGLASGFTLRVAIASARKQRARCIIAAIPTAHSSAVIEVAQLCDHVYCANVREGLRFAVADAYEHWRDVTESEVMNDLKLYHQRRGAQ
jgi:putative phosphoribosyl transferase